MGAPLHRQMGPHMARHMFPNRQTAAHIEHIQMPRQIQPLSSSQQAPVPIHVQQCQPRIAELKHVSPRRFYFCLDKFHITNFEPTFTYFSLDPSTISYISLKEDLKRLETTWNNFIPFQFK